MNKAKIMIATACAIAVVGAGAIGVGAVFAAQHGPGIGPMSGLVNAIASKFHLTPSDVQAVFDQQRQTQADAMKKQADQRFSDMLAQAVKDGKLTQAQADLITAKQKEIQTFQTSLQGKSPADRQTAMKTESDSLKAWATANNIPQQYVMPFRGGMMRGGGMGRGMRSGRPPKSAPPAPSGT